MKYLNFGDALARLDEGLMLSRSAWSEEKLFVFKQVPSVIGKDVVPKMQSLPQAVKTEFEKRFENPSNQVDAIYYECQFAIVNQSNLITGWSPSPVDVLSSDWFVVE